MKTITNYNTTKAQATDMGRVLVQRLNDRRRGWKLHVWENLGWHYSALHSASGLSVSPSVKNGEFYAMLQPSWSVFYRGHKAFRSPHKAIEHVISGAEIYAAEVSKHVNRFRSYYSK